MVRSWTITLCFDGIFTVSMFKQVLLADLVLIIWFFTLCCLIARATNKEEWDAQVQSQCWKTFHPSLPLCKLVGGFQWNLEDRGGPGCCKSGCFDVNQDGHVDLEDFAILQNLVGEEAFFDTDGSFARCGYAYCASYNRT